ncbi:hypothetical protein [Streptomyces sp. AC627_RSS907]|uniref:hypothetical protein n=1 Tax=Streptomyces sp. AC627_RSS907 TaxID=2823684 RepID=UPI001C248D04|nr:hypothetical protein [Streptomyces sp. AC627_RSS907]
MNRTKRCTAVVTLAAGVLAGLTWAAPAQAADETDRGRQAAPLDFSWPAPPQDGPLLGGLPDLPGTPDSEDDFSWPVAPGNAPGDIPWPLR